MWVKGYTSVISGFYFSKQLSNKWRNVCRKNIEIKTNKSHLLFHVLVFIHFLLVLLCGSKPAKENVKKDQMSINWWLVYFFTVPHHKSLKETAWTFKYIYIHIFMKDNVKGIQLWNVLHFSAFEPRHISCLSQLIKAHWSSDNSSAL